MYVCTYKIHEYSAMPLFRRLPFCVKQRRTFGREEQNSKRLLTHDERRMAQPNWVSTTSSGVENDGSVLGNRELNEDLGAEMESQ
jgi:hypothetical protein